MSWVLSGLKLVLVWIYPVGTGEVADYAKLEAKVWQFLTLLHGNRRPKQVVS